jgi:hypothetical protein
MPRTTQRWISEKVKSLRESDVLPFHDILDARMVDAALAAELAGPVAAVGDHGAAACADRQ